MNVTRAKVTRHTMMKGTSSLYSFSVLMRPVELTTKM